jgi:cobalt-zinc-cadmium efflux system outer membrane protein
MRKACSWGLLALASVIEARAEEVTEEQFLAALNAGHAAVKALGEDLARAEAARRQAGTLGNPRLEFWREQPGANPRLTNWTLAWTPPLDGRFGLTRRAADAGVAAAREGLQLDRALLRREMRRVFAEWSLGHRRCALLARRLERIAALAEQERQRARVGAESGLAARRLALAEAEARAALREAEAGRARARAEARAWHPRLAGDDVPSLPALASPPEGIDPGSSPQVRSVQHQLEQSQLEARVAGRYWGFPTLQAGMQRLEEAGVVRTGPILAAGWSIPIFDRSQGARAEAGRRAEIAASRLSHAHALVGAQIQGGIDAYRSLFTAVREAQDVSADIDRVIEAATAAYRAGESTLTDLLDALRSAFDAHLRDLDLRGQALAFHRDLEAALGRPLGDGGVR